MRFRQFKHMFKNSYKNASKNKAQVFGVVILVFFLSLVLSSLVSLNVRVIAKYNEVLIHSRVHDAVIDLNPYDTVSTGETRETPDAPKNAIEAQQYWIQQLQEQYARENPELDFDWSRTEAREFSQVNNNGSDITIKTIAKTTQSSSSNINNTGGVDDLVIFDGSEIITRHQVVVDPNFAKSNNISIGSIVRIQSDNIGDSLLVKNSNDDQNLIRNIEALESTLNKIDDANSLYNTYYSTYQWYQVVGFGISADFVTPVLSESKPLPNRKTEMLMYVSPESFGLSLNAENGLYSYDVNAFGNLNVSSTNEQESFYSLKFKNISEPTAEQLDKIETDFRSLIRKTINNGLVFGVNDPSYRFATRLSFIKQTIIGYNIASIVIFASIMSVVLYSISLITKKQIENASKQLGTLKALGYKKRILVFNFIMLPFLSSVIGGFIGYFASIFISNVITNVFSTYFSLNYSAFEIDWVSFVAMIGIIWFVLTLIAFTIAIWLMRKSALSLLSRMSNEKPNSFKILLTKIKIRKSFSARLRKALFVDALGKMIAIGAVVLVSSQLFTVSFAAPDILQQNKKYSVNGLNYSQIIEYSEPSYNNPMSFLRTYEPTNTASKLVYAKQAKGWTGLPLTESGNIDIDQVISDYFNNDITNKYYSIFIDTYFNQSIEGGNVIPTLLEFALANMKMLNLDGVLFDTNYFKEIAKYGVPPVMEENKIESLILPTILGQWFDYQNLLAEIKTNSVDSSFETKIKNAEALQNFYKKQSQTIGLSVTNDFRVGQFQNMTQEEWINEPNDSKIDIFNDVYNSDQNMDLKEKYLKNNEAMIKQLLGSDESIETIKQNYGIDFAYTNKNWKMGEFKINDKNNLSSSEPNDYYVGINFSKLDSKNQDDVEKLDFALVQYWKWFTFMCYNRVDQSIIQTSFSRPPYFVQQNINKAYNSQDKNYSMSFNLVPYNDEYESLGTKLNAIKNGLDFKIYGIENEKRFLDLKNEVGEDLIEKLFASDEENGIIINQSLAKSLNLSPGDEVGFDIIQSELQDYDGEEKKAFSLDDWDASGLWSGTNGFKQNSRTNKFGNIVVKRPIYGNSNAINFMGSISAPSNYYRTVLDGKTIIGQKSQAVKFKVLGIQNGYGAAQAWVKNDDAKSILKYDEIEKYFWKYFFSRQWNSEFGYKADDFYVKSTINLENKKTLEIEEVKKILNLDLTQDGNDDLDTFKNKYINSETATDDEKRLATLILDIFKNQYPVFNYKYSTSNDIGDYGVNLSIANPYGDYSPTSLNGLGASYSSTGEAFDGSANGAIGTMFYIETYKEILEEISQVILIILTLIIILIVSIAFVIIQLTTTIVINDNIRFISTMRVLGYTDRYVVKTVMSMYGVIIAFMFAIGYIAGWFIFVKVVNVLAMAGTVLPLAHPIWLPFVVGIGIIGIYIVAIWIGYRNITKINSVSVLQNSDV